MVIVHTTKGASEALGTYEARCVANGDGVYVYVGNTSGADTYNASNWVVVSIPGSAIHSVNGYTQQTVVLDTDDIEEDATAINDANAGNAADVAANHHRYYTQARVSAYLATLDARDSMLNGAKIVYDDDTLTLDCGTSVIA